MRSDELAWRLAGRVAGARDALAVQRPDADPGADARVIGVDRHAGPGFADIRDRAFAPGHAQAAGTMHVIPLGLESTLSVKHLDAMVLTVGNVNPAVLITANVVDDVELARLCAGFAPGEQQPAVRRVLVDPSIAVAVGDVQVSARGQSGVGAAVERIPAHVRGRFARNADLQQHFAVGSYMTDSVVSVVGAPQRIVGRNVDAVRARKKVFAPGPQELAGSVKDKHRML